jgi:hypothetical protein
MRLKNQLAVFESGTDGGAVCDFAGDQAVGELCFKMLLNKPFKRTRPISRFSLYDARLNGAGYLCKCLGVDDSRLTKDIYETGKFDWGDNELTLSDSVIRVASTYLR